MVGWEVWWTFTHSGDYPKIKNVGKQDSKFHPTQY